jgi:hypothetical protein
LLFVLLSCSSDTTSPTNNNDGDGPPPSGDGQATATAQEVTEFAAGLYAAKTGAEAKQTLHDFFVKFGLPVLSSPPAPAASPEAQSDVGPYVLDVQIERVAEALVDGVLIDMESFFSSLYSWDAVATKPPYGRLSRQYITDRITAYGILDKLDAGDEFTTEDDLIPAMIIALGRERNKQSWIQETGQVWSGWDGQWHDPVWGDNFLDPVQFLMLSSAVLLSSAADSLGIGAPARGEDQIYRTESGAAQVIAGKLARNLIKGALAKDIEVPLGPGDAIEAAVCASINLFGYTFEIAVENSALARPFADPTVDPEVIDLEGPEVAAIQATLVYNPIPGDSRPSFCDDPGLFPTRNKPVTWEILGDINFHGNLDITPSQTDDFGKATATYRASLQAVPPYLRTFKNEVTG